MRKDTEGRVRLKIVFYGPSLSGKTTQLKSLYNHAEGIDKGKFTSLEDPTGRTLFFDFVPMQATGKVIFDVYTTAGQSRHKHQRKIVLNAVDGIIFVVDSSKDALQDNIDSLKELRRELGSDLGEKIPMVVTLNKRDLPNALPRGKLLVSLDLKGYPVYETIATEGFGVKKAFQSLAREILLKQIYQIEEYEAAIPSS
ncbi:MAG: ATP/GTP-binding protein [Candidatus Odinarchaeota archaeon]